MDNITRNDAINRVRDYIENNTCSQKYLEAFKLLIPELNDSKDEIIRKALVQEFKEKVQKSFEWKDGIPNNAVLDWLERQKQVVKTKKPKFSVGEKIRYRGAEYEITGIEGVSDGYIYNILDISPNPDNNSLYRVHSSCELHMEKIVEQKESWTEEDEKMFSDLLFFMERYKEKIDKGSHPYVDKVVNWFKSKFNK